jgi:hypothetical protein
MWGRAAIGNSSSVTSEFHVQIVGHPFGGSSYSLKITHPGNFTTLESSEKGKFFPFWNRAEQTFLKPTSLADTFGGSSDFFQ